MDEVKNRVENLGKTNKPGRFMELEGLRVIAAAIVVLYHAALIFYPAFYYGVGHALAPVQNMRFEDNLYQNPISALLSGTLAVGIFFVLSGFVLSVGFFKKEDPASIKRLAAKRYPRLMLPALASILIVCFILLVGGRYFIAHTYSITHSNWLGSLWLVPPDLFAALNQGIAAVFTVGEVYYNPVLWTIHHEFIGSFVVFGCVLLFASSRYRWLIYVALLYVLSATWLLGFITGMILADIYVHRREWLSRLNNKYGYALLVLGIFLGGYPAGKVTSVIYKSIQMPTFNGIEQLSFFISVGATLIVIAILSLSQLTNWLAHPRISGLGKYTYSLYLIHMPVLLTVCTSVFLLVFPIGFHKASVVAAIVGIAAVIPVTYWFERYIDAPSVRFSSYCADVFLGKKALTIKDKLAKARLYGAAKLAWIRRRKMSEIMPEIEMD
jgi:peptidoglycan/LPS O-acetylase OafA/YrhL